VLAVPVVGAGRVRGVLAVESRRALRFDAEDEIALRLIADVLGPALLSVRTDDAEPAPGPAVAVATAPPAGARPVRIRFFETDESVFVGDEYLIKGVAGAILRKILDEHLREGRTDFSNRELRADPGLPLPALRDNLDARLVLLRRRMEEKLDFLRLEKSGRGRFRLVVERPFVLESVAAG
jgi:hypothetical protein